MEQKIKAPLWLSLVLITLFLILTIRVPSGYTALISMGVILCAIIPFFISYEKSRPRTRDIVSIAVMVVLAALGRMLFAYLPGFKPMSAIIIIGGIMFGKSSGFLIGALAALVSNFFFGQGIWTPWQMYGFGLIGFFAGALRNTRLFQKRWPVCLYGFLAAYLYGLLLNTWYTVSFLSPFTLPVFVTACLASLSFDTAHAVSTAVFLFFLLLPWRKKIQRIKTKYGLHDF